VKRGFSLDRHGFAIDAGEAQKLKVESKIEMLEVKLVDFESLISILARN